VGEGSPEHVMTLSDHSHTGRVLKEFLAHQQQ
jgi:excinuclease ABC subunit A